MKDPFTGEERKEASPPMYTEYQMRRMDDARYKEEQRAELYLKMLQECQKELALLKAGEHNVD